MKKLLALTIILIGLVSCSSGVEREIPSLNSLGKFPYNRNLDELTIVTIDSCEYIIGNDSRNVGCYITHKGNCKNHK